MTKIPALSTGIDIVSISRIRGAIGRRRFSERVFTPGELEAASRKREPERFLAAAFAAKEATAKALGVGFGAELALKDIALVERDGGGATLSLSGGALKLLGGRKAHISTSASADLAVALVVLE